MPNTSTGGTYDPVSGIYIPPSGIGQAQSRTPEHVPIGTETVVRPVDYYKTTTPIPPQNPPQSSTQTPTPSAASVIGQAPDRPLDVRDQALYAKIAVAQGQGKDIYKTDTGLLFAVGKGQSPYSAYGPYVVAPGVGVSPSAAARISELSGVKQVQAEKPSPTTQPNQVERGREYIFSAALGGIQSLGFETSKIGAGQGIISKGGQTISSGLANFYSVANEFQYTISNESKLKSNILTIAETIPTSKRFDYMYNPQNIPELNLGYLTKETLKTGASIIPETLFEKSLLVGSVLQPEIATGIFFSSGGLNFISAIGAGKTEERVQSEVQLAAPIFLSYGERRIESYSQLRGFEKELKISNPEKYSEYLKDIEIAKSLKEVPVPIGELKLSELKLIQQYPELEKPLQTFLSSKTDIVVGGSLSSTAQIEKGINLNPRDIDVYVYKIESGKGREYAREVGDILSQYGFKEYIVKGEKVIATPKGMEELGLTKETLIEFQPLEKLRYNIEQVTPIYQPYTFSFKETTSGIKILDIGTQIQRKVIGGYLEEFSTGKYRPQDITAYEELKKSLLITQEKVKLPEIILRASRFLPYKFRPSEMLAFGLQERFVERGFGIKVEETKGLKSIESDYFRKLSQSISGEEGGRISTSNDYFYSKYKSYSPTSYLSYPTKNAPKIINVPTNYAFPTQQKISPPIKPSIERTSYPVKSPNLYSPPSYPIINYPIKSYNSTNQKISAFDYYFPERRLKQKKKKGKFKEGLYYVPSFTARVLGIKQIIPKKDFYKTAYQTKSPIEIRGIPVFR